MNFGDTIMFRDKNIFTVIETVSKLYLKLNTNIREFVFINKRRKYKTAISFITLNQMAKLKKGRYAIVFPMDKIARQYIHQHDLSESIKLDNGSTIEILGYHKFHEIRSKLFDGVVINDLGYMYDEDYLHQLIINTRALDGFILANSSQEDDNPQKLIEITKKYNIRILTDI